MSMHFSVIAPVLRGGSYGPAVTILERELVQRHFRAPTGERPLRERRHRCRLRSAKACRADAHRNRERRHWRALYRTATPQAKLSGNYIEIDKTKQLLYVVRGGKVKTIVPVSTGKTGNTPVGTFHVYRKAPGWSGAMFWANYFLRGFAVHGYPFVPPWPASHGCVRLPLWVAKRIYDQIPMSSRIYIHY